MKYILTFALLIFSAQSFAGALFVTVDASNNISTSFSAIGDGSDVLARLPGVTLKGEVPKDANGNYFPTDVLSLVNGAIIVDPTKQTALAAAQAAAAADATAKVNRAIAIRNNAITCVTTTLAAGATPTAADFRACLIIVLKLSILDSLTTNQL